MINKPPPFNGLDIRIPIIIPIKGRGLLIMGLHYTRGQGDLQPPKLLISEKALLGQVYVKSEGVGFRV